MAATWLFQRHEGKCLCFLNFLSAYCTVALFSTLLPRDTLACNVSLDLLGKGISCFATLPSNSQADGSMCPQSTLPVCFHSAWGRSTGFFSTLQVSTKGSDVRLSFLLWVLLKVPHFTWERKCTDNNSLLNTTSKPLSHQFMAFSYI